ncbi:hypothetical protein H9P43_004331 [Blastocladiella emersonii ATCC 22665]|nr:hypothetical protein H9P43_004331 [Blastocladiella emersonii ATCC 22665]
MPVATISTPGALAAAAAVRSLPPPPPGGAATAEFNSPPPLPAEQQQIPFSNDDVHTTWSEFTKKKNTRAELTRLENISWRIWHALRLRTESGRPQPRFAVRVDAATACFVDPRLATPAPGAATAAAAAEPAASPVLGPAPPAVLASAAANAVPMRGRKQSLQVDPRTMPSSLAAALHGRRKSTAPPAMAALPAPSNPTPPTPSSSSSNRPYIVITLPPSLLDRATAAAAAAAARGAKGTRGRPAATAAAPSRPLGTRGSGAASPSGLIKRCDRHVDLSRYFGVPSLRMLTSTLPPAIAGSSSPTSPSPVVFVMGDDDSEDESDEDDDAFAFGGSAARPRASLDESRSGADFY